MSPTETEDAAETGRMASVRFLNVVSPQREFDVDVGGFTRTASHLDYTSYGALPAGNRDVEITSDKGTTDSIEITVDAARYTIVLTTISGRIRAIAVRENRDDLAPDRTRLQFVHSAPSYGSIDITAIRQSLQGPPGAGSQSLIDGLPYGKSRSSKVETFEYDIVARRDTQSNDGPSLASITKELEGGTTYFGVLHKSRDDSKLSIVMRPFPAVN
jgi:hypothetical protein